MFEELLVGRRVIGFAAGDAHHGAAEHLAIADLPLGSASGGAGSFVSATATHHKVAAAKIPSASRAWRIALGS